MNHPPTDHRRGVGWALGAAVGIAAFNIPWKLASESGGTASNALLLLASAAVLNTLLTTVRQRGMPRFTRLEVTLACALACLTLAANLASAEAIRWLTPALLTVTQRSEIILVALLAWPIVGERVDRPFWIGAGLALIGLAILHNPFDAGVSSSDAIGEKSVGVAWGFFSAICFAGLAVLTRRYVHRIKLVAVNALRLWLSVLLWFVVSGATTDLSGITAAQVGYASLAAFCGPFAGRLCLMMSARYIEARVTTLTTLSAPLLTLVLAFVVLGELPAERDLLGGAVILAGIALPVLARLGSRRTEST